jgi:hypothetical protein
VLTVVLVPKIRERLAELGRRPVWLSQQTGIDLASISRIMAGKPVMLETALNVSAALGVPVESIWVMKEVDVAE